MAFENVALKNIIAYGITSQTNQQAKKYLGLLMFAIL